MIARLIKWLTRARVRVVDITVDRRTREQRLWDQHHAILRSDARFEIEFRERVRRRVAKRIERQHLSSLLQKQAG